MTSSSSFLARVRELRGRGTIDERVDVLVIRASFEDDAQQSAWLDLRRMPPAAIPTIQIYDSEISGDIADDDPFDPDRVITVTIVKPEAPGVGCFFFQDRIGPYLSTRDIVRRLLIADLPVEGAFRARGLDVRRWDLEASIVPPEPGEPINPRKLVSDFVPDREVPADLSPWMLVEPPVVGSKAHKHWEEVSARRLLASLVSSAWLEHDQIWLQASGPPVYRIQAGDPTIVSGWDQLTGAATWVFLSGYDVEARHRLFSSELARAGRPDQPFEAILDRAIEAAKVAYEAHLQSSSRETLKALADLRKTVIEEAQKVTQRTQDMTAGLWRDLAVSVAPFALKILADAGKVTSPGIAAAFYFAAALFIALSFLFQWRMNAAFFESQKLSRERWMQSLFTYISRKEREEIADAPIEKALENYRHTRNALLFVYGALVLALLFAGARTAGFA